MGHFLGDFFSLFNRGPDVASEVSAVSVISITINLPSERNILVAARSFRLLSVLSRVRGVGAAQSVQGLRFHGDARTGTTANRFKISGCPLPQRKSSSAIIYSLFLFMYSADHPLCRKVLKMRIWEIPPAGGPLLQLLTEQVDPCNL